jgi:hypothetical protein
VVVTGALLILLGFAFATTTVISVLLRWSDGRLLRRLRAAANVTCAELTTGPLPREVLLTGRTAPGTGGALRSPAYDTVCVWYETEVRSGTGEDQPVTHVYHGEPLDAVRVTDRTGSVLVEVALLRQVGTVERLHTVRTETTPIKRAEAASSGSGIARLDDAGLLPASTRPWMGRRHLDLREATIPVELEISVLARPRRTARADTVTLGRKGQANSGTPQAWIAQLETDRVTSAWILLVFPLIGGAFTAVGMGLIWIGAF